MRRIWLIAAKDVLVWLRDIAALGVLLAMPIVLILILGSAFGGAGTSTIPVAVVNLDEGWLGDPAPGTAAGERHELGDDLVQLMRSSDQLGEAFGIEYDASEEDVRRRVAAGDLVGALIVPDDFSELVMRGEPAELELLRDPGSQLGADIWESVARSFAAEYAAASIAVQTSMSAVERARPELLAEPSGVGRVQGATLKAVNEAEDLVTVEDEEAEAGAPVEPLDYYAVSMTAMFLTFGSMFGAFSTIKERREQTLSRLLSTPTSRVQVNAGKMLGVFLLGMTQFTVLFLATRYWFGVDWGDDLLAIFAVAAAEVLAVTGFAVLVAAVARSERAAGGIAPLVIQIQALLGGAFFAIAILPEWLQPVRYASVIGWAMEGWQTVQLQGGGIADVIVPISALLGFAAALFVTGTLLTRARS